MMITYVFGYSNVGEELNYSAVEGDLGLSFLLKKIA